MRIVSKLLILTLFGVLKKVQLPEIPRLLGWRAPMLLRELLPMHTALLEVLCRWVGFSMCFGYFWS